jgi:hypothetical protein
MRKVIGSLFQSLDGVIQAPENSDELRHRWPFGLWRGNHGTGARSRCTFFGSVALTSR